MNSILPKISAFLVLFFIVLASLGTHNRAGEIIYRHVEGFEYEIEIITYTRTSAPADRPWLKLKWGDEPAGVEDSDLDSLERVLEDPTIGFDIKKNVYIGRHVYGGPGTFVIIMEDPNRNEGVENIFASVNQVFCIASTLIISPLTGQNNSAVLTNPPVTNACLNQIWTYNCGATDPDGDELRYSLVPSMGEDCVPLLGWDKPDDWTSEPFDTFIIDPVTGDIVWDVPLYAGEYNIAILVEEYRNDILVGKVIRDMQINVFTCNNQPPQIAPLPDYCIEAGDYLEFFVTVTDPNNNDVELEAFGGPMSNVIHPAVFQPNTGKFSWTPECEEVQNQNHYVVFQATDDGFVPLSDVESVAIKVVAPRVENPIAEAGANQVNLSWEINECAPIFNSFNGSLVTYQVYRRNNQYGFTPDECELGVPEYTGYELIGESQGINNTSFVDDDVLFGGVYCYMVVTVWPDGAESYASEEFCDTLVKDVPVMTKASISFTDPLNGVADICWSPPTLLDTTTYVGPYQYRLYHREGLEMPETIIYESAVSDFLIWGDTCFTHSAINSADTIHNYRVAFLSNGTEVAQAKKTSSPFLRLTPLDNAMRLNLELEVTWTNTQFEIWRREEGTSEFTFITVADTSVYLDENLVNNREYCYKIKTIGSYNAPGVTDPIINWSQEECAQPYDQEPPCPPRLTALPKCELIQLELVWEKVSTECADDVTAYNIYYSPSTDSAMRIIASFDDINNTLYAFPAEEFNNSIAGCFAITALDSLNLWPDGTYQQNESALSELVCVDNCPIYFLPNVFTPNGDANNDFFRPFPYRYIQSVDFKVFNRWGAEIFSTTDPDINWNGTSQETGEIAADGVYFYTIQVNTIRLDGIESSSFSGQITILGGKQPTQQD